MSPYSGFAKVNLRAWVLNKYPLNESTASVKW